MIAGYDNPLRHRLFSSKENNKEVRIKESLIEAAKNGHTDCVRAILEDKTINVNIEGEMNYVNLVDEYGNTPLLWAARNDHIKTVGELLKHKMVYVNLAIQYGSTALIEAAR